MARRFSKGVLVSILAISVCVRGHKNPLGTNKRSGSASYRVETGEMRQSVHSLSGTDGFSAQSRLRVVNQVCILCITNVVVSIFNWFERRAMKRKGEGDRRFCWACLKKPCTDRAFCSPRGRLIRCSGSSYWLLGKTPFILVFIGCKLTYYHPFTTQFATH